MLVLEDLLDVQLIADEKENLHYKKSEPLGQ
mgnify:CR=1 FL=1